MTSWANDTTSDTIKPKQKDTVICIRASLFDTIAIELVNGDLCQEQLRIAKVKYNTLDSNCIEVGLILEGHLADKEYDIEKLKRINKINIVVTVLVTTFCIKLIAYISKQ